MGIEELRAAVRAKVMAVTGATNAAELPVGLSTAQSAKVLNRSKKTLRNWSSSDSPPIRPNKDAQGRLLWPIEAVEALLVREDH